MIEGFLIIKSGDDHDDGGDQVYGDVYGKIPHVHAGGCDLQNWRSMGMMSYAHVHDVHHHDGGGDYGQVGSDNGCVHVFRR